MLFHGIVLKDALIKFMIMVEISLMDTLVIRFNEKHKKYINKMACSKKNSIINLTIESNK